MAAERTDKVFLAKLAEEMGRYEDMVGHMKDIIAMDSVDALTLEERSLLSVAYKNVIGARRASWRVTYGLQQRYQAEGKEDLVKLASEYRKTIEKELVGFCTQVLDLVDKELLPKTEKPEYKVFFMKMKGDCYRYQAEIYTVPEDGMRKEVTENAQKSYEEANKIAKDDLKSTDPTRLGLMLNFSVFLYEILNQQHRACQIAQEAFDLAMNDLQERDDKYDDTTMILQSMRDNLILWTSQDSSDEDEEEKKQEDTEAKEKAPEDKEQQQSQEKDTEKESKTPTEKKEDDKE